MTTGFIYRPIKQADESPGSVLLRVSYYNGYGSPMQIINCTRKNKRLPSSLKHILTNGNHFLLVCQLLGIEFSTGNDKVIPQKNGMTRQIFWGVDIHRSRLRTNFSYCPLCLREDGYHRHIWEHRYICVCIHHQIKLVEQCRVCALPIEWNRKSLYECQCGESLIDIPTINASSIVESYLQDIFISSNQAAYDDFEEMLQALTRFLGQHREPRELQELSIIGLESPEDLAEILVSELLKDPQNLKYHPKLTMVDFSLVTGEQTKLVAQLTIEKFNDHSQTESYFHYEGELLDYRRVSKVLGINHSQAAELRRHNIFRGYQLKPGAPFSIEQASIHTLLFRLGALPRYTLKQSVSIDDCLKDSDLDLTLSQILKGVLNESIKLVSFSWSAPLLSMTIEKQYPKFSRKEFHQLVPLKDYVEYTGLHSNDVRHAIKEFPEIDYFDLGYTNGANKYLTVDVAELLTEILKNLYFKPSKVERIRNSVAGNVLPVSCVPVYFK